ncbi:uncharacterized protein LY89DRAFT_775060 [Mollisia scopiformis]|uniref:2EXR domain-containing protein n=1 Tax=Mollisia scopiformis TaxID=149040 RepID=A0A194XFG0_MOLSC|nr:uncharacterized protein LY89DRAFT_775060 [Mollisia scopiformis]KUJ18881.1 hypothetical protein LY89DRAFT_775060 [Mollisia scopiformis]
MDITPEIISEIPSNEPMEIYQEDQKSYPRLAPKSKSESWCYVHFRASDKAGVLDKAIVRRRPATQRTSANLLRATPTRTELEADGELEVEAEIMELFAKPPPLGRIRNKCWVDLRERYANSAQKQWVGKDRWNVKEVDAYSKPNSDFLFFELFPAEIQMRIFEELASYDRFIEIERQYSDLDPIPYWRSHSTRIEGTSGWHRDVGARFHQYFRVSQKSLRPPLFFNISQASRSMFKKLYSQMRFDNLDPRSEAAKSSRIIWFNPKTDIILFWVNTCTTTLKEFCQFTHKADIEVPRIALKRNSLCCHWSQDFDQEHADFAIVYGEYPEPGMEAIEFLHGIDPDEFLPEPAWTASTVMTSAQQLEMKRTFPGCKGFRELLMLGTTDIFGPPRAGMVDENTVARVNHDKVHNYCDMLTLKFAKRQQRRIENKKRLTRLTETVPRWTALEDPPKIRVMQLAQRNLDFPPNWNYRVDQYLRKDVKLIVPSNDLTFLKIIAVNNNCQIQVQTAVGERGDPDEGLINYMEIGIIGPTEKATSKASRDISDLKICSRHFSTLSPSRTHSLFPFPVLETGKVRFDTNSFDFEKLISTQIMQITVLNISRSEGDRDDDQTAGNARMKNKSIDEKGYTVPNTFHCFPTLPSELRLKIWSMVANQRRIIEFRHTGNRPRVCSRSSKPPAVLHTNYESRTEGLKFYEPREFDKRQLPKKCYYNPKADILLIGRDSDTAAIYYTFQRYRRDGPIPRVAVMLTDICEKGGTVWNPTKRTYEKLSILQAIHGFAEDIPGVGSQRRGGCVGLKEISFIVDSSLWPVAAGKIDSSTTFRPAIREALGRRDALLKLRLCNEISGLVKNLGLDGKNTWVGKDKPTLKFVSFAPTSVSGEVYDGLAVDLENMSLLEKNDWAVIKQLESSTGCKFEIPGEEYLGVSEIGLFGERKNVSAAKREILKLLEDTPSFSKLSLSS